MPTVRVRQKYQITIPSAIVQEAGIHEDDMLDAEYVNGVITLVPRVRHGVRENLMNFAGIASKLYGRTAAEIETTLKQQRDEWER